MSTWRRKAIESFPDLRQEFEQSETTIYQVFFELLPRLGHAHDRADTEELKQIYGFARWCYRQKSEELRNAAAVGFYEHLVDSRKTLEQIPYWLERDIFEGCKALFAARLKSEEFNRLCEMYSQTRAKGSA